MNEVWLFASSHFAGYWPELRLRGCWMWDVGGCPIGCLAEGSRFNGYFLGYGLGVMDAYLGLGLILRHSIL